MTPGFQSTVSRQEGQWQNLFRRINGIRRSAAILCYFPGLSHNGFLPSSISLKRRRSG